MDLILLIIVFGLIIAAQAPPLIKKKMWKELAAFGVLLLIGMFYSFGLALNLPVPNPAKAVEAVFAPLTKLIQKVLI